MDDPNQLLVALEVFGGQLTSLIEKQGLPPTESDLCKLLVAAIRTAGMLPEESVSREYAAGSRWVDIWVVPSKTAIEVKYERPIPSGRNRPLTQQFGHLLSDFNKIRQIEASTRVVLLIADRAGASYLRKSGRSVLPLLMGDERRIDPSVIAALPQTAQRWALIQGRWSPLMARFIWRSRIGSLEGLAWAVS